MDEMMNNAREDANTATASRTCVSSDCGCQKRQSGAGRAVTMALANRGDAGLARESSA